MHYIQPSFKPKQSIHWQDSFGASATRLWCFLRHVWRTFAHQFCTRRLHGARVTQSQVLIYQLFRYLCAGEAFYRTVDCDMSHSTADVTRLSADLEGQDWVGAEDAVKRAASC